MFELTSQSIIPRVPDCPNAGGFVTFEGKVRNLNEGREVRFLEYEAYGEMAVLEGEKLVAEAIEKFGLSWAHVIHRTGMLEIGEAAVWIGCAAAHRQEAFQACEFLIDELKHRLPIWKKEHYVDGPSEWVNLNRPSAAQKTLPQDVFARQIMMPEIGPAGQAALQQTSVLVVGAGGLACGALPYLAGAGIGSIGIVEPDLVDMSNLHRQILFGSEDVGRSKAQLAAGAVRRLHPFTRVAAFEERLCEENAERLISGFDIVIDGTDRFDAKFLMNDTCQRLGKPLVQASVHRVDGYVQTILPGGPCLRCQWEETPSDGCVKTCAEAGVLGVVPGFFGILQAMEVVKLITGFGETLSKSQLWADLNDLSFRQISRPRRAGCLCERSPLWQPKAVTLSWEVTAEQVQRWSKPFICLDIREETEPRPQIQVGQQEWRQTPMSKFQPESALEGNLDKLIVCASGIRSARLVDQLRGRGFDHVYSLKGGVGATCKTILD